jgi:hypothetical protein
MMQTRLRPVIESLIVAQRALTRALAAKDVESRKTALIQRDRAANAIDEAFLALELAHAAAVSEQERLKNREINLASILIRLHREHPEIAGQGIEAELIRLEADPRMGETFLSCLNEAVEDGCAVRRGHTDVRITFAGVQQLLSAKRLRADLETSRAEQFRLEQRLRAAERSLMTDESLSPATNNQPRKAAAGA